MATLRIQYLYEINRSNHLKSILIYETYGLIIIFRMLDTKLPHKFVQWNISVLTFFLNTMVFVLSQ